jgi:hypothetical protein
VLPRLGHTRPRFRATPSVTSTPPRRSGVVPPRSRYPHRRRRSLAESTGFRLDGVHESELKESVVQHLQLLVSSFSSGLGCSEVVLEGLSVQGRICTKQGQFAVTLLPKRFCFGQFGAKRRGL